MVDVDSFPGTPGRPAPSPHRRWHDGPATSRSLSRPIDVLVWVWPKRHRTRGHGKSSWMCLGQSRTTAKAAPQGPGVRDYVAIARFTQVEVTRMPTFS